MIAETNPDLNQPETLEKPPRWMTKVLLAAAIYNLAWGLFAIAAPTAIFRWVGLQPLPLYPEFWQCIGMIVGVYGIGYWIASSNPYRHWPIVLVGLLGKVFGPIGFAYSVWQGRLPAAFGWTIVTNDLIWWAPFSAILWNAARVNQSRSQVFFVPAPGRSLNPLSRKVSQFGSTLTELSRRQSVLVVFLRHSGCTFCREALSDIAEQRKSIESQGATIALVHMGQSEPGELLDKYHLNDLHCFRDPNCVLYDAFGLQMGGFRALFGMKVWWRGFWAWMSGHGIGPLAGNGFRMPGVFLIHRGNILRSFKHLTAADRPDYVELAMTRSGGNGESHGVPIQITSHDIADSQ